MAHRRVKSVFVRRRMALRQCFPEVTFSRSCAPSLCVRVCVQEPEICFLSRYHLLSLRLHYPNQLNNSQQSTLEQEVLRWPTIAH